MSFFGLFRKSPEEVARDAAASANPDVPYSQLRQRHAKLLDKAGALGLDLNTLLILLQRFGPVFEAMLLLLLQAVSR